VPLHSPACLTLVAAFIILPTAAIGLSHEQDAKLDSILDWGAKCDGHSIDNEAVLASIRSTKSARIPDRTCILDSLDLPSGSTIEGNSYNSDLAPGATGTVFSVTGSAKSERRDITFRRLSFSYNKQIANKEQFAISITRARNINVLRCQAQDIQLLVTSRRLDYHAITPATLVRNVVFENNQCISAQSERGSCGEFRYIENATVSNNEIHGYLHGLMYWGGDSDHTRDGQPDNPRWAMAITFSHNRVSGSGQGGIWGSMGKDITVSANSVSDVGDVGIDFEGTQGALAEGNTCRNARNGCGSTFFFNSRIIFRNNNFTQPDASEPILRIYNSARTLDNKEILIANNVFKCEDPAKACTVDDASGPAALIEFVGNHLYNSTIAFDSNNTGRVVISGNSLIFGQALEKPAVSLQSFGATSVIDSNKITSSVKQNQNAVGIDVKNSDYNHSNRYEISNNDLTGFFHAIRVAALGKNAGTSAHFEICGNSLHSGEITKDNRNAKQSFEVISTSSTCKPTSALNP